MGAVITKSTGFGLGGSSPTNTAKTTTEIQQSLATERYMDETLPDGTTIKHPMPSLKRVTKMGRLLWSPSIADTPDSAAYTTSEAAIQKMFIDSPVVLTRTGTAYDTYVWSGLSIKIPDDGLLQFLMYSDNLQGFKISITTNSGKGVQYAYLNSFLSKGRQKTFQIWDSRTDADLVLSNSSTTVAGDMSAFDDTYITELRLTFTNGLAGRKFTIDGLYSQTKITPFVVHAPDVSNPNVFENFTPLWLKHGWSASLRVGGNNWDNFHDYANWGSFNGYGLQSAYRDGFDIFNGSWSRLGNVDTDEEVNQEVVDSAFRIKDLGFPLPVLYSSSGNSLPSRVLFEAAATMCGLKYAKAPGSYFNANILGVNGLDSPLYLSVVGQRSFQDMKDHIDGLLYVGGFLVYYWHECNKFYDYDSDGNITGLSALATSLGRVAGEEYTTVNYESGGSVWWEAMIAIADYMKPLVDDGKLEVVNARQMHYILTDRA